MRRIRVIPVLLVQNNGLYKTVKFKAPVYVGDPLNAIKIFNEKEVDELVVLDILATREKKGPNFRLIANFANECFMPVCYGGGITNMDDIMNVFKAGIEKVSINSAAFNTPNLISAAAERFGIQSIMVSIDVRKNIFGKYQVHSQGGSFNTRQDPSEYALRLEKAGAGEILLNSIDQDGMMDGYDYNLIELVSSAVTIPVIACGGAGKTEHFAEAIKAGASAVAAGSMFVFHGKHRAVLISYTSQSGM